MLQLKIAAAPADQKAIENDLEKIFNATPGYHRIVDLINKSQKDNLANFIPYNVKDEDWNSLNPNPSHKQYFDMWVKETEQSLSPLNDANSVVVPKKEDWIDLEDAYINDAGKQRFQPKHKKTARNVWKTAINFSYPMAKVEAEYIDIPDHPLNGKYNIWDGGGTVTAALLRGINKLPAKVTRVTREEDLGNKFFTLAHSVESVAGEETFKYRYYLEEPLALLQGRIYKATDTTPMQYNTNTKLKHLALTALKRMIEESFHNTEETSISGDPKKQLKDAKLFGKRKCHNIIEVLEAIQTNWNNESPIVPAVFKELVRFYATFGEIISLRKLNQMISDYKDGSCNINGVDIHSNCARGVIDWSSQKKLSEGLKLQSNTDSHRSYGTYVLAKCWNNWAETQDGFVKFIDEEWLEEILHTGESKNTYYLV